MAKKDTIRYTADNILRYHSGEMSNSEMHSIEKAALEDPFLADAIEGYKNINTEEKDIEEIKQRLSNKKENKVISIKRFGNVWTRIAALLIVILGIGYYTYQTTKKPDLIVTSRNVDTSTSKKDVVIIVPKSNTISNSESITAKESHNTRKYKERLEGIHTRSKKYYESHVVQNQKADNLNGVAKNDEAGLAPQSDKAQDKISTYKDSGITAMRMKVASTEKYRPSNKMIPDSSQRSQIAAGLIKDTTYIVDLNDDSNAFKNYVSRNKKTINKDDSKPYKGVVILSFIVNKNGKPEKIRVEKSLCPKCDQQAITLLKQGPRWNYSQEERKKVIINW